MPAATSRAIVIGASAGAVGALSSILPAFPADYRWPIMIVVHLPPDTDSAMAQLFAAKCRIQVKEAEDKENICAGVAYFAPPNYHLLVELNGMLSLSSDEPELFSRPSINVLFESARDAFGAGLVGVVLTGASNDGAEGLRAVCHAGGLAFVQDPATAEAAAMPKAALAACPGARAMTLQQIAASLVKLGGENSL